MNDDDSVTHRVLKAELAEFKTELKTELRVEIKEALAESEARLEARFEGRMDVRDQRLLDRIQEMNREMETHMLKAFYSYAEGNDQRIKGTEIATAGISGRVASLETRVLEIEKRLNLPPAA